MASLGLGITIGDVMQLAELKECHLLNDGVSLDHPVSSITIMDTADIVSWVEEGEILLSNGLELQGLSEDELISFFGGLIKKKVPALFLKLHYYLEDIPDRVLQYLSTNDFPLIIVPNKFSWVQISDPIQRLIIEQKSQYLDESLQLRDMLNEMLIKGATFDEIYEKAVKSVGHKLAIFSDDHRLKAPTTSAFWQTIEKKRVLQYPCIIGSHSLGGNIMWDLLSYNQGIVAVSNNPSHEMSSLCLAVWFEDGVSAESELNIFKLEQIRSVLKLAYSKDRELQKISRQYYTNFLYDLINGTISTREEVDQVSKRLHQNIYDAYQLIVIKTHDEKITNTMLETIQVTIDRSDLPDKEAILACTRKNRIILFYPVFSTDKKAGIEALCSSLREIAPETSFSFGVSRARPIYKMQEAYDEAEFALSVSKISNCSILFYEELGLIRLFAQNSQRANISFISEFYESVLAPLVTYDMQHNTDLVETLSVYLQENGVITKAADRLYIHQNTMRIRVSRIEEILDKSLKNTSDLTELSLAMQIHRFI